jgi:protein disulfide-isomerase A6
LAPTWESLASDYSAEPGVLIAKVDAEAPNAKATAEEQGVKSYPTIKFFPKGSTTPEDYNGGRSAADFVSFINEKAGTHRTVGGGLDATAGIIASLDDVVKAYVASPAAAGLQKISTEAGKLKEKYASYYAKVAQKQEKNEGYLAKELKRLEGLMKKGGLAPEKLDDLVSRSNILRAFQNKPTEKEEL